MDETIQTTAQTAEPTAPTEGEEGVTPTPTQPTTPTTDHKPSRRATPTARSFTQQEVNDLIKSRLGKSQTRLFARYGVADQRALDDLISRAQSYSAVKQMYDELQSEHARLSEDHAFMTNGVDPSRYDDVRAYFKGKGIDFGADRLAEELKTHPEWLGAGKRPTAPTTTITPLGVEANSPKAEDERTLAMRILGAGKR